MTALASTSNPPAAEPASPPRVVVVVPCRNEAATIGAVVRDFARQSGVDTVLVVDNASTDATAEEALAAGAQVITETRPGKGLALWAGLCAAPPADYYAMVDGDATYPADALGSLIESAAGGADMVVGSRLAGAAPGALPAGHGFGNWMFIALARTLFGLHSSDLLSGYRVLSRRFVQTLVLTSIGFEVELELSLQALQHGFRIAEVPVQYLPRPHGSVSKLRTFRDGSRLLAALVLYFRDLRPLTFFGSTALVLLGGSLVTGGIVIRELLRVHTISNLPLAVAAVALLLLAGLSLACGVVLSSINRRAAELAALVRAVAAKR
jgi:glycosyltransferase involved in cell wall biosynthesis